MGDTAAAVAVTLVRPGSSETMALRLPVFVASTDIAFTKELVKGGAGVTILPRLSVQRELDEGRLVHLLPGYVAPGVSLFLLHRGGRYLAPKIRVFIDYTRAALAPSMSRPSARRSRAVG
jgi:DNA-binding transcriptional LysR family regulator